MLLRLHCNNITRFIFWVEESQVVGGSLSLHVLDACVFAVSKYTSRYNFKLKNKKVYWINSSWLVFYLEQNRLSKLPIQACMRNGTKPGLEFSKLWSSDILKSKTEEEAEEEQGKPWDAQRRTCQLDSWASRDALFLLGCFICWFYCALLKDFELKMLCG